MSQDAISVRPRPFVGRASLGLTIGTAMAWGSLLGLAGTAQTLPTVKAQQTPSQTSAANSDAAAQPRFLCQWNQGQYMVMYNPQSRPEESFPWATPSDMGGGWSAERRCNEISRRLEEYRPDGLVAMKTSTENGYNIVCVTTESNSTCRIVFTVPPGQDPVSTRNRVFENLATADDGGQTQAVNTFVGTSTGTVDQLVKAGLSILTGGGQPQTTVQQDAIQLRPFLDAADGGTGRALTGGVPRSSRRLNPSQFR
jgi:hypothetical protein